MSTSGTTGATPTPQQPVQGSEVQAPVERQYVQTVETTKTDTDKSVGQVFQNVTKPTPSHDQPTGTKPTENRTETPTTLDSKVSNLAQNQELAKPQEKKTTEELEFEKQRDNKETVKEGWMDLSEETPQEVPVGAAVNPIANSLQTPTKEEGNKVETASATDAESLGLASMQITELTTANSDIIAADAHTQVNNKEMIEYVTVDTTDTCYDEDNKIKPEAVQKRKVDPDKANKNEARINRQIEAVFVTPETLGGLLPEQYKARLVDSGTITENYSIHLITNPAKESVQQSFNNFVQFHTNLKQNIETIDHYRVPTSYDNKVGPHVIVELAPRDKSEEKQAAGVAGEKGAVTQSGTGTAKEVKTIEDLARERAHLINEHKKLMLEITEKKREFEEAYWNRQQAARRA